MATVDLCLHTFSAKKITTCKFHVGDSTKIRYDMIIGRDIITALVLYLKFSVYIIIGGDGSYKGCSAPMSDVTDCNFKPITEKISNWENPLLIRTSTNVLSHESQLVQPEECVEY